VAALRRLQGAQEHGATYGPAAPFVAQNGALSHTKEKFSKMSYRYYCLQATTKYSTTTYSAPRMSAPWPFAAAMHVVQTLPSFSRVSANEKLRLVRFCAAVETTQILT